jgi:NAD(P)-dependent dehydrogenase (short-subunit alcohol dehydrogenase family)
VGVLDSFRLNGRVSAVTGANRGIGRALAVALAEAGSDLALVVRDPSSCAGLIEQVAALGVRAEAVAADVTDLDAVTRAVDAIAASHGRIDVLVNNAGDCIHRPALEVTPQEWARVIDTNVTGVWNCSQSIARSGSPRTTPRRRRCTS